MEQKITVGKAAVDLMNQTHEQVNPIEYEKEIHKTFESEINECVKRGLKQFQGDFYVVVLKKRERLLNPVYRAFFLPRQSCPTPTHDQIVYKYHRRNDTIEFLWVIPDLETATVFRKYALEIAPEERGLLGFVLDFYDGTLDALAKKLNNEEEPDNGK